MGWLLPNGVDEIAHAQFAIWGDSQHAQDSKSNRIRKRVERMGEFCGVALAERSGQHRGAALR